MHKDPNKDIHKTETRDQEYRREFCLNLKDVVRASWYVSSIPFHLGLTVRINKKDEE